jgi:hypothetical protein
MIEALLGTLAAIVILQEELASVLFETCHAAALEDEFKS